MQFLEDFVFFKNFFQLSPSFFLRVNQKLNKNNHSKTPNHSIFQNPSNFLTFPYLSSNLFFTLISRLLKTHFIYCFIYYFIYHLFTPLLILPKNPLTFPYTFPTYIFIYISILFPHFHNSIPLIFPFLFTLFKTSYVYLRPLGFIPFFNFFSLFKNHLYLLDFFTF